MIIKNIISLIDLKKASITEITEVGTSESTGVPGVNKSYKVTLDDKTDWIWKPKEKEHISKWRYIPPKKQFLREFIAYLIDKQLGFNLVPETKIVKIDGEIGSLQKWIDDLHPSDKTLKTYSDENIWKMGLLDCIIANTDRHSGNWGNIDNKPIAYDNGFSLPNYCEVNNPRSLILSRFACAIWNKPIPHKYLSSIMKLKELSFQRKTSRFLDRSSFDLLNKRIDAILRNKVVFFPEYKVVRKLKKAP